MRYISFSFLAMLLMIGGLLSTSNPAQAGSCTYPVTTLNWTGKVNSGVHMRDRTCMDSNIVHTLAGGSVVNIVGEADGWYQIQLADGTKGFVWYTFITVTSKDSNPDHEISDEYTAKEEAKEDYSYQEPVVIKQPIETTKVEDTTIEDRVKGYILLQVESFGEAWYVHPEDGKRYYMKDGEAAYNMMRYFGLGISNADIEKVFKGDSALIEQLKGKIILQVELHGEAYYIHPKDGSVHYLKDGPAAYKIMRELSLGITNNDLNKVGSKDFDSYVQEREGQITASDGEISLSGYSEAGKVILKWNINGVDVSKGFKVLKSLNPNPVYPGDAYHYLSDPNIRLDKWTDLENGKTYNFRVCQYLGGVCGVYSNNVSVTVSGGDETKTYEPTLTSPSSIDTAALNEYWLAQVNALRAEKGLRLLVLDNRWVNTATEWAEYMASTGNTTHDRPDGKTMHQWIDGKGLDFTERYSIDGWSSNYFTENISWGIANDASNSSVEKVLDDTMAFFLAEESYNGAHYRTIYHQDWNSVGVGFAFVDKGNGQYKVFVAMHYGSLEL